MATGLISEYVVANNSCDNGTGRASWGSDLLGDEHTHAVLQPADDPCHRVGLPLARSLGFMIRSCLASFDQVGCWIGGLPVPQRGFVRSRI